MTKEEFKEKFDKVKKQIKANSKDARYADKLISELISLKGQMDVNPIDDMINEFKVDYRHNYGSAEIMRGSIRNVLTYVYATNGYRVVVRGDAMQANSDENSLFQWLNVLSEIQEKKDKGETLAEKEEEALDALIFSADNICQIPLFAFFDDETRLSFIKLLLGNLERIVKPLTEDAELQNEEPLALEDMQDKEQFKNDLKQ